MKNKEEQTAPKLRFKGYTDAWQQRRIKNIAKLEDNKRIPVKASLRKKGSIPYFGANGIQDHVEGFTHTGEHVLIAEDGANSITDYPVYYISKPSWINNHAHVLTARPESDNLYLSYGLKNINYSQYLVGSGRYKLNSETLKTISLMIPSKKEQVKVAYLLSKLDDTITLLQRKKKKYENLKKALLQNLFPKNKKFIPDVRFKNFTDLWQPRRLGDIGSISAGGDVDKQKLSSKPSYPVIANALTNEGIIGYYQDYKIEAPAVTVTGRGSIGHAKARFVNFTPIVRLLVIKTAQNPIFLENSINQTMIYNESTGVPQLTVPQLTKYKISISSIPEQNKIGQLLSKLDDTITLLQKQINTLTSLKQFLLQNMFI